MTTTVSIRPATVADAAAIRAVADTTWRATYRGHIADTDIDAFIARAYSDEALQRTVERLAPGAVVAQRDDAIVGYAFVGHNRDARWELFAIYVLPAAQDTGAGRQLWDAAVAHVRGQGGRDLCLAVLRDNAPARAFYAHMGAQPGPARQMQVGANVIEEVEYVYSLVSDGSGNAPA